MKNKNNICDNEIEEDFYYHLKNLHKIATHAFSREFNKLYSFIDENYFRNNLFPSSIYQMADDFIFRNDVTYLSYGQALKMAYTYLQKRDYYSFLLSLKTIIVKLKGNQRYTYFDRDEILNLLNEMKNDYSFEHQFTETSSVPEILLDKCEYYLPIGFEEMTFDEYNKGSTRSYFDSYKHLNEKILEKEFNTALKQGSIYHYIVEIDHYINSNQKNVSENEWIFLSKLLLAYYAMEKYPWSRDMTLDLLRTYIGIRETCKSRNFTDILLKLVTSSLKIVIKKFSYPWHNYSAKELKEIINFLVNVYTMDNNNQYLIFIEDIMKMIERIDNTVDLLGVHEYLRCL